MGAQAWVPRLHGSPNCGEPRKAFEQRTVGPSVCQKDLSAQLQDDGEGWGAGEAGDPEAQETVRVFRADQLWFQLQLSPVSASGAPPPNWGGPFRKISESFLPSHPSFQTCFLFGLQTYSHSSYLPPLSLPSECLLWLLPSPALSLLQLVGDALQNRFFQQATRTHGAALVFSLL